MSEPTTLLREERQSATQRLDERWKFAERCRQKWSSIVIEGKKLTLDMPLSVDEVPDDSVAFRLRAGAWKFDFDKKSRSEIDTFLAEVDGRPRMCSAIFPSFASFRVVEFGPADGYNTAQLEKQGVKSIVAIEAIADNFIKCLIMKNAFNLDAKFLLGNFLKYLGRVDKRDSHGALNRIQAGICDGDQLGTRPDVG